MKAKENKNNFFVLNLKYFIISMIPLILFEFFTFKHINRQCAIPANPLFHGGFPGIL